MNKLVVKDWAVFEQESIIYHVSVPRKMSRASPAQGKLQTTFLINFGIQNRALYAFRHHFYISWSRSNLLNR